MSLGLRRFCVALVWVSSSACPGQGLVAHWDLNETAGVTANDLSPQGNHGTLQNFGAAPWGFGFHGGGLQLDGLDDHVAVSINAGLPIYPAGIYAVTAWVKAPPQVDTRYYAEGSSTSPNPIFTLGTGPSASTDRVRVFVRNNAGLTHLQGLSTTPAFDNTWHHIAWVDNNGMGMLYIDGTLDATSFNYTQGPLSMDRAALGAVLRATPCCFLNGCLDDVRVYNHYLTPADVLTVLSGAQLGAGYQLNRPGARADVNGVQGSSASSARASVPLNSAFTLNLASDRPGMPWDLFLSQSILFPNLLTFPNNIVNVNVFHPTVTALNGFFTTPFGPILGPGTVQASYTWSSSPAPLLVGFQFAIIDPTAPGGFLLSAATELNMN